jgi:hypothetical protein
MSFAASVWPTMTDLVPNELNRIAGRDAPQPPL